MRGGVSECDGDSDTMEGKSVERRGSEGGSEQEWSVMMSEDDSESEGGSEEKGGEEDVEEEDEEKFDRSMFCSEACTDMAEV